MDLKLIADINIERIEGFYTNGGFDRVMTRMVRVCQNEQLAEDLIHDQLDYLLTKNEDNPLFVANIKNIEGYVKRAAFNKYVNYKKNPEVKGKIQIESVFFLIFDEEEPTQQILEYLSSAMNNIKEILKDDIERRVFLDRLAGFEFKQIVSELKEEEVKQSKGKSKGKEFREFNLKTKMHRAKLKIWKFIKGKTSLVTSSKSTKKMV